MLKYYQVKPLSLVILKINQQKGEETFTVYSMLILD